MQNRTYVVRSSFSIILFLPNSGIILTALMEKSQINSAKMLSLVGIEPRTS